MTLARLVVLTLLSSEAMMASTITINGTMSLVWQYDLNTNSFNNIPPLTMNVQMSIDDQVTGSIVFAPTVVRTLFGTVEIDSPLFGLLGFDTSDLQMADSGASAQGNQSPPQTPTWLTFSEDLSEPGFSEERSIEFNDGPAMADPSNFTSADLDADLLQAAAGGMWSMRDDGGGLQNLLEGTITGISITGVPEPETCLMVGVAVLLASLRLPASRR